MLSSSAILCITRTKLVLLKLKTCSSTVVDKISMTQMTAKPLFGPNLIITTFPFSICPLNYYLEPKDEVKTLVSNKNNE